MFVAIERPRNAPPGCVSWGALWTRGEQDPGEAIAEIRVIREAAEAEAGL